MKRYNFLHDQPIPAAFWYVLPHLQSRNEWREHFYPRTELRVFPEIIRKAYFTRCRYLCLLHAAQPLSYRSANKVGRRNTTDPKGFICKSERSQAKQLTPSRSRSVRKPLGSMIPEDCASQKSSNFFNAYAKSINIAYSRTGSLFEHPFGRVPITDDRQFWTVIAYIHQNPQKHKFVKDFRDWKYSSYEVILSMKHTIIKRDEVMKWFGNKDEYLSLHNDWVADAQSKWFAGDDYDWLSNIKRP